MPSGVLHAVVVAFAIGAIVRDEVSASLRQEFKRRRRRRRGRRKRPIGNLDRGQGRGLMQVT